MGVVDSGYVSDHTRWMNEQLEKNPSWAASQKEGRALWWDKPQRVDEQQRVATAQVPVKPYYYDSNH